MTQITKVQKLGQIVQKTRKKQGLTQEQLSAVTGVGVRFIRELERGKESCYIGKVLMVLTMLGLELQIDEENL